MACCHLVAFAGGMPHKHYQAPVSLAPPKKPPSFEVPQFQTAAGRSHREPGYAGAGPGYAGVLPRDPAKVPTWQEKREVFYVADGHNGNKGETFHLDTEVVRQCCFLGLCHDEVMQRLPHAPLTAQVFGIDPDPWKHRRLMSYVNHNRDGKKAMLNVHGTNILGHLYDEVTP